jgi:D-alanyl-D-alanine carboxypeptidase (penicillin-binding protein 5/6)
MSPGAEAQTISTTAKFALLQDFDSGATLFDKAADEPMAPASMSKLLVAEITFHELKEGHVKLDDKLHVSEYAWRTGGAHAHGSAMFLAVKSDVRVEDLLRGLLVQSGNDAAIVLAEGIAGSEEQFVDLMNARARQLGLTHTTFRNCTGWPDAGHVMSARDIATLAAHLIRDFPDYYHYDSERTFKYNNIDQQNRNPLVQKGLADGLKTGHTDDGGFGVVASAERSGRRIIMVLNGMTSMHQRGEESERLLEWAFREFEDVTLFTAGDTVEQAPVWLGEQASVPLVGGRDLQVTMPRNWRDKAKVTIDYDAPLRAPILRGTTLGQLTVRGQGVPDIQIPLLAGADVPRLGLTGRAMAVLSHMVTGT